MAEHAQLVDEAALERLRGQGGDPAPSPVSRRPEGGELPLVSCDDLAWFQRLLALPPAAAQRSSRRAGLGAHHGEECGRRRHLPNSEPMPGLLALDQIDELRERDGRARLGVALDKH